MVDLRRQHLARVRFHRHSVGVEMSSFANRGFDGPLLAATARRFAFLCYHLQISVRHARAGVGPDIAAHNDLGGAGGGHNGPSDDPSFMQRFITMVDDEDRRGHFSAAWDPDLPQKVCLLSRKTHVVVPDLDGAAAS